MFSWLSSNVFSFGAYGNILLWKNIPIGELIRIPRDIAQI